MSILVINSSIRGDDSISRELSLKLSEKLTDKNVVHRDLTKGIDFISSESMAAVRIPKDDRSAAQSADSTAQLADTLIEELQVADTIVIGAPVYNFGPPASLKAWADLVARAGTTFQYTENGPEGLLENKKAYVIAVSGGTKIGSEIDFMSPWLIHFLGFIGIKNVEIVSADGVFSQDGEEKIQKARQKVERMAA
ncbi:MAG: NAD(P)H-dependent oxidoreductase [Cyanobacteria bacterium P01_A01_bin.116]